MKDFKYWIKDETVKLENNLFMYGNCFYTRKDLYDIYLKIQRL